MSTIRFMMSMNCYLPPRFLCASEKGAGFLRTSGASRNLDNKRYETSISCLANIDTSMETESVLKIDEAFKINSLETRDRSTDRTETEPAHGFFVLP